MSRTHVKHAPVFVLGVLLSSTSWSQQQSDPDSLEEVVVTGTRAALVESLDRKRDAQVVQDSIVAEDLGRFPDANVADSLSHITGITLQRTRGGEGQYVNVRGLGPELQHRHVERPHSRDRRRRARFRLRRVALRSHLRRRRVQVRQRRESRRQHRRIDQSHLATAAGPAGPAQLVSIEGDYNDLSENTGYKASGVFSNTFAEDRMGVMLTAVYQDDRSAFGRRA